MSLSQVSRNDMNRGAMDFHTDILRDGGGHEAPVEVFRHHIQDAPDLLVKLFVGHECAGNSECK